MVFKIGVMILANNEQSQQHILNIMRNKKDEIHENIPEYFRHDYKLVFVTGQTPTQALKKKSWMISSDIKFIIISTDSPIKLKIRNDIKKYWTDYILNRIIKAYKLKNEFEFVIITFFCVCGKESCTSHH